MSVGVRQLDDAPRLSTEAGAAPLVTEICGRSWILRCEPELRQFGVAGPMGVDVILHDERLADGVKTDQFRDQLDVFARRILPRYRIRCEV
jgi:hypothetical protein